MGKAAVLKLAEVLYDIGECAVELGMFDNAVRDYGGAWEALGGRSAHTSSHLVSPRLTS